MLTVERVLNHRDRTPHELPEVGDLLPIEALHEDGLLVTSDGRFARAIEVLPLNPHVLEAKQRERLYKAFTALLRKIPPGDDLQVTLEAGYVDRDHLVRELDLQVERVTESRRPDPTTEEGRQAFQQLDPLSASRWMSLDAIVTSLVEHIHGRAALDLRVYIVVPMMPAYDGGTSGLLEQARDRLSGRDRATAPLHRSDVAHDDAAYVSRQHVEDLAAVLRSNRMPARVLNGEEYASYLWRRLNPTQVSEGREPEAIPTEIYGSLKADGDQEAAVRAARSVRSWLARSPADWSSGRWTKIDDAVEITQYAHTHAETTRPSWWLAAMNTREPFTVSVHIRATDLSHERRRLKLRHGMTQRVIDGQVERNRRPNDEVRKREQEERSLLETLSLSSGTQIYRVAMLHTIRAPGPDVNTRELLSTARWVRQQVEATTEIRLSEGRMRQQALWLSTLPFGQLLMPERDADDLRQRYTSVPTAFSLPILGTHHTPTGVPWAMTPAPWRTVVRLDPFDQAASNFVLPITGASGSGKTVATILTLLRLLTFGVRCYVIDQTPNYRTLASLIPGAVYLDVRSPSAAINPMELQEGEVSDSKISFVVSLIRSMLSAVGESDLTDRQPVILERAIRGAYRRAQQEERQARLGDVRRGLGELAGEFERARDTTGQEAARSLYDRMEIWCEGGAWGLLDRESTFDAADTSLVVIVLDGLAPEMEAPVALALTEWIERDAEVYRTRMEPLAASGLLWAGKTAVVLEELWRRFSDPALGTRLAALARTSRRRGQCVIPVTQSLTDFDNEYGRAFVNNASSTLLLNLGQEPIDVAVELFRLNAHEAEMVEDLTTDNGVLSRGFLMTPRGRGPVELAFSNVEQWIATSHDVDVSRRNQAIREYGGSVWQAIYALAGMLDAPPTPLSRDPQPSR